MIQFASRALPGIVALLCAVGAGAAEMPPGPPPPAARGPSLEVALAAVQAAIAACADRGFKVSAVVADSSGAIKAAMVSDGVNGMTASFALKKIAVALDFKQPSSAVAAQAKSDKALAAKLAANPNYFALSGAVLLKKGEEIVGAVAASGAAPAQDEACALAAAAKVQGALE